MFKRLIIHHKDKIFRDIINNYNQLQILYLIKSLITSYNQL